jgi:hypothetical protein
MQAWRQAPVLIIDPAAKRKRWNNHQERADTHLPIAIGTFMLLYIGMTRGR